MRQEPDQNRQVLRQELQVESPGGNTGKYDFDPGVNANAAFTAKTKTATLSGAAGTIECKKSSTAGEWVGPEHDEEVVTFTSCEFKGEVTGECHSAGQPAGTIVTRKLVTTVLGEGQESFQLNEKNEPESVKVGAGEVWDQFNGPGSEGLNNVQAEYQCASVVVIKTEGSLAGVFSAGSINVASKKAEISFGEGKGAQGLFSEANVLGKGFVPVGKGVETTSAKSKAAGKLVLLAAPSLGLTRLKPTSKVRQKATRSNSKSRTRHRGCQTAGTVS